MAGAGYKLFATGDVLTAAQVNTYLMQQTVMVFASSAARTSALSGVLAEGMVSYLQDTNTLEVYDGSAWVGATGDITGLTAGTGISISSATGPVPTVAIDTAVTADLTTAQTLTNKTLTSPVLTTPSISNIEAKGDILVGTADNTLGVLTAGSNGETLVADSSTSTGLRYQGSMAAGKNFLINGGFDIWQRGTSFVNPANNAYVADRWNNGGSAGGTYTISQQTTGVPAGSQYYMRTAYNSASSYCNHAQIVETANTILLQGKTVTFTVKLRKNASLTTNLDVGIAKSATVDAGLGASWTVISSTTIANASLPTGTTSADWLTVSVTAAIPNDGTANSLRLSVSEVSVGASGAYWEMAQAQLELGSVATTFSRAGGTIQGELAACQRYYYRTGVGSGNSTTYGVGMATSTTAANIYIQYPVTMRVLPSSIDYADLAVSDLVNYTIVLSTLVLSDRNNIGGKVVATVASGLSQYRPTFLINNTNLTGYLGFSAEL